jgi:hypothetical protein
LTAEPSCKDEARIGQKNGQVRQCTRRGTRPRQPADQRYDNAYLFGAICPARGVGAALRAPRSSTRSRTSGNIYARTGSQTQSSKTTTRSSTLPAPPGANSSPSPKPSHPSNARLGPRRSAAMTFGIRHAPNPPPSGSIRRNIAHPQDARGCCHHDLSTGLDGHNANAGRGSRKDARNGRHVSDAAAQRSREVADRARAFGQGTRLHIAGDHAAASGMLRPHIQTTNRSGRGIFIFPSSPRHRQ